MHKGVFRHVRERGQDPSLIDIAVYVLVAIVKKRLGSEASLYTILQILSLTLFEKTRLDQLLANSDSENGNADTPNQLDLFT